MKLSHRLAVSDNEVSDVAAIIGNAGPDAIVAYDTETGACDDTKRHFPKTAGLHPYAGDYMTGLSVCVVHPYQWADEGPIRGYYVPVGHREGNASQRALWGLSEAFSKTAATHVLHHACFDWAFLANTLAYEPAKKSVDTQVLRWLQDENAKKGLKTIGAMYLGEDADLESRELAEVMGSNYKNQTDAYKSVRAAFPELPVSTARSWARRLRKKREWGSLTVKELAPYAARDATLTAEVYNLLTGISPAATVEREMAVNQICYDMTRKGVSVDVLALESVADVYMQRAASLKELLKEKYGLDNPNSPDQVRRLLYDELGMPMMGFTDTGEPGTGKEVLEQLAGDPVAAMILQCRHWDKARTAYAEPFAKFANLSADGRVHGHYSSVGTVTGRLAASGPNVMTIPREDTLPEIRAAFNLDPAKGVERLGFDLKSAELWVMASITGDPTLTAILQEGRNMHTEMMVEVFGGEPDKSRREYTVAKNVNYSMAYEAGLGPLKMYAAKGGFPPDQVEAIAYRCLNGHKKLFARQHVFSELLADAARKHGKLPLHVPGRFRHFRTPGRQVDFYTALNALVQGGIGEAMKDFMIELYARGYGEFLILQVHDELVFDVPTGKGLKQELLQVLNKIALDTNPFRYPLQWSYKSWNIDGS